MITVWVVVGLGLTAAASVFLKFWRRTGETQDMGAVSHQWIAEHRLGTSEDPRR